MIFFPHRLQLRKVLSNLRPCTKIKKMLDCFGLNSLLCHLVVLCIQASGLVLEAFILFSVIKWKTGGSFSKGLGRLVKSLGYGSVSMAYVKESLDFPFFSLWSSPSKPLDPLIFASSIHQHSV